MNTVAKIFSKIFLSIFVMLFSLTVVIIIINSDAFDEELDPEIIQLMNADYPFPTENNGYIYYLGIMADLDKEPYEVGLQYLQEMEKQAQDLSYSNQTFLDENFSASFKDIIRYNPNKFECDRKLEKSCLSQWKLLYAVEDTSTEAFKTLLNRYETLMSFETFTDKPWFNPAQPIPEYRSLININNFGLANSFSEDKGASLAHLKRNIEYWVKSKEQSHTIIQTMIVSTLLNQSLELLSLLLNEIPLDIELSEFSEAMRPIQLESLQMTRALQSEYLGGVYFIQSMTTMNQEGKNESFGDKLGLLVFQRNASINGYYRAPFKPLLRLSKMSPYENTNIISKCTDTPDSKGCELFQQPDIYNWNLIYNPIGKVLNSVAVPAYSTYILRAYQPLRLKNLIHVQIEIKSNPEQDPQLTAQQSQYRDPFTNQPFEVDSEQRIIKAKCESHEDERTCQVYF